MAGRSANPPISQYTYSTRGRSLAAALFGACASGVDLEETALAHFSSIEQRIADAVDDPERLKLAVSIQRRTRTIAMAFFDDFVAAREQLMRLNQDHGTSTWAYERLSKGLSEKRKGRAEELIQVAMELRKTMTEEEWRAAKGD